MGRWSQWAVHLIDASRSIVVRFILLHTPQTGQRNAGRSGHRNGECRQRDGKCESCAVFVYKACGWTHDTRPTAQLAGFAQPMSVAAVAAVAAFAFFCP